MTTVRLDANGFFDHMCGSERGLSAARLEAALPRAAAALADLADRRKAGALPFYDLPADEGLRRSVAAESARLRERFERLVVLGIGGSALGTRAVLAAVPQAQRGPGIKVDVVDNVDPVTFAALLDRIDPAKTAFNVISKSGTTAETMSQLLIVRDRLVSVLGEKAAAEHFLYTTDPSSGLLRKMADAEGIRTLTVPDGVGGRFSVLSAVGLLPIAAAGIDVNALCAGARAADSACSRADVRSNPAALHALLLYLAKVERGAAIHVLMPYCDGLAGIAEWYAQLWAESLGKRYGLDGSLVEAGQTPVRAIGATDQHSQVQLYMEGPHDKVVTFIRVECPEVDIEIPRTYAEHEAISYLGGHSLGALLNMEQRGTELALAAAGRLTSLITLERVDAEALGYLFHLFEVQTLVAGALFGVDPLDQPGVEAGKVLTHAMAGRKGFADKAAEVEALLARKKDALVIG